MSLPSVEEEHPGYYYGVDASGNEFDAGNAGDYFVDALGSAHREVLSSLVRPGTEGLQNRLNDRVI